jgi:hypothetical protein
VLVVIELYNHYYDVKAHMAQIIVKKYYHLKYKVGPYTCIQALKSLQEFIFVISSLNSHLEYCSVIVFYTYSANFLLLLYLFVDL